MKGFDFIVVGSGIAGLNFALNAAEKGRVLVLTKKDVAESSTNYAQGGISAVLDKADSFDEHVKDTLEAGAHHNNVEAVEFMVKKGPEAIKRLIEFGVEFDESEGHIDLRLEGGHSSNRIVHVGDYTGKAIEEALVRRVKEHDGIEVWEDAFVVDVLIGGERCSGVRVIRDGGLLNVYASAVILATGGLGRIYKYTSNPGISTGDGLAMAARAGCSFRDMEFVQFHPTAFCWEGEVKFLLTEALRGEGAYLCDENRKRVLEEGGELAPRDVVARAVFEKSKSGQIYLKFPENDADLAEVKFPHIYKMLQDYGLDLGSDLIPIMPAAHFICGGIETDLKGRTGVEGLFAFGEVAGTGVHGANRLGSNSLLEALVFSGEIVDEIGRDSSSVLDGEFDFVSNKLVDVEDEEALLKTMDRIKEIMWEKVGIVRGDRGLEEAVAELGQIKKDLEQTYEKDVSEDLMVALNMVTAGLLVAKAALGREGNLGGHWKD